jgi:hypothetical protein
MRSDEYCRLRVACLAMARQSQLPDVQARWAKLADAAFVSADAAIVAASNRRADRELERKIPIAPQARIPNRTNESRYRPLYDENRRAGGVVGLQRHGRAGFQL